MGRSARKLEWIGERLGAGHPSVFYETFGLYKPLSAEWFTWNQRKITKEKDSMFQPDFPEGSFLFRNYRGLELKSPLSSASEEN